MIFFHLALVIMWNWHNIYHLLVVFFNLLFETNIWRIICSNNLTCIVPVNFYKARGSIDVDLFKSSQVDHSFFKACCQLAVLSYMEP